MEVKFHFVVFRSGKNKFKKYFFFLSGFSTDNMKQQVRSVVECRRKILKNFIRKYMMGISGKCPHCSMPRKQISRYNMRLVYVDNKKGVNFSSETRWAFGVSLMQLQTPSGTFALNSLFTMCRI